MRFAIWQSVKVTTTDHHRTGQAGTVQQINPNIPDEVGVRFDSDGSIEAVNVDDLGRL